MINKTKFNALLACTSRNSESLSSAFDPIPQAATNIKRLFGILVDPAVLGLPLENVELLFEPDANSLFRAINQALQRKPDNFLFYYCGHGDVRSNRLILPTSISTIHDLESTAICAKILANTLDGFVSTRTLTILDCCFSREYQGAASFDQVATLAARGFAETIAITGAAGFANATNPTDARYTLFSGELIKILSEGIAGGSSVLTAFDIFCELKRRIKVFGGPKPEICGDGSEFAFINNVQSGVVQGGRLDTVDALFRYLCESRDRCQEKIRLMQIRRKPPVKINDGKVLKNPDGSHQLIVQSEFAESWYNGLIPWGAIAGHQFERITLDFGDSLVYAKELHQDTKAANSSGTIRFLKENVAGLPAYNFCIFDDQEMTITYGRPYGDSGISVWFRNPRVVRFFCDVYEHIKANYTYSMEL